MYGRRRLIRKRMMRRVSAVNRLRDVATFIFDNTADVLCAIGIFIGVFYIVPAALCILASAVK